MAIVGTLLAPLALGVMLIFTRDRSDALFSSVLIAVGWGAGMIVLQASRGTPSPLTIRPDELPQTVSLLTAVVRGAISLAFLFALAVAFTLAMHNYVVFGIALAAPIMAWDSFRRARRTERESGGTLWAPTKIAWTAKGRYWFLVTEQEPFDEEL